METILQMQSAMETSQFAEYETNKNPNVVGAKASSQGTLYMCFVRKKIS